MIYHVEVAGRSYEVVLGPEGTTVDGRPVDASLTRADGTEVGALRLDGRTHRVLGRRTGSGAWTVRLGGEGYRVDVVDERTRAIRELAGARAGAAGPDPVVAPMPGMVVKVEVTEGDVVSAGQGVVIVEAMKMENELKASAAGVVRKVLVAAGEAVERGQVLVELGAEDGPVEGEEDA